MAGWNLSKGDCPFTALAESDVIRIVNSALSPKKKHTTTYKYAFFKALLDNLFNVNLDNYFLSYEMIAFRFTEIYWNLILKFHLSQMSSTENKNISVIEQTLQNFCVKHGFDFGQSGIDFPFENLRADLQIEIVKEVKTKIVMKYVLGAFYEDLEKQFYHFDKKASGIFFNPDVLSALIKYKTDFEKLNYYEWIKYLEKVNEEKNSYALASKLDASTERKNLSSYRQTLEKFGQKKCFYCNKTLAPNDGIAMPVDHFIPWSFVKDDKLWNFVLACQKCNSAKSNHLPKFGYIEKIKDRNLQLQNFDSKIVDIDFKSYAYSKLVQMYHSAVFNGFSGDWKPQRLFA